jgi:hypothetical protein
MAYSYAIYWLTQSNFSTFTPLRRSGHVWRACIAPVPTDLQRLPLHTVNHSELYGVGCSYSPPLSDIKEDEIAHVVIDTVFDPSSAKNKCFKPPRDKVLNTSWSAAVSYPYIHASHPDFRTPDLIRSDTQICFHFRLDSISTSDPYTISFLIHFLFI